MDLVRGEPFEGLNRIQRRINDLFDQDIGSLSSLSNYYHWSVVSSCGHSRKQGFVLDSSGTAWHETGGL
jgi:hypothetical protein